MTVAKPDESEKISLPCTTGGLFLYFLRLGAVGFGGPIALVAYMQRDLVDERKWVSKEDYLEGLAFSQLCPGPLAAQLAKYIGWLHGGVWGATMAGVAFVLPSFLMVLTLAAAYVHFGQLAWIQGLFYGIGDAVSAIIVRSAWKLIIKTIGRDYVLWALFLLVAVTTVWTQSEIVWLFILSGIIAVVVKAPPKLREKIAHVLALTPVIGGVFGSFSAGTVTSIFFYF